MNEVDETGVKNKSLVRRLFNGDLGLAKTFWLYYFCVKLVVIICIELSERMLWVLPQSKYFYNILDILDVFIVIYFIAIIIPIWKSVQKYKGNVIYSVLAMTLVVLNAILTTATYILYTVNEENIRFREYELVETMNKGLPTMIGEGVMLNKIYVEDDSFVHVVKLIDQKESEILSSNYEEGKLNLIIELCSDEDTRSFMKAYSSMVYRFYDGNDVYVRDIEVTSDDCKNNVFFQEKDELPIMVDEVTQLNGIYLENNIAIYEFKILTVSGNDINMVALKNAIEPDIKRNVCSSEDNLEVMREFRGILYKYSDKNNEFMFSIPITLESCTNDNFSK